MMAIVSIVPNVLAMEVGYWAQQVAACALIEDLADWYCVDSDLIWRCLSDVDEPSLLDSPYGWELLGLRVGDRLGIVAAPYVPMVH